MTECLSCPQPPNAAAVALQLQQTALQAEECLYDLERSLRAGTNPPTLILTTTAAQPVGANTSTTLPAVATATTFANSSLRVVSNFAIPTPPGVYLCGVNLNATVTAGVLIDNSLRSVSISVRESGIFAPTEPDLYTATKTVYEPNNGNGVDMNLTATVTVEEMNSVHFSFLHNNTGATVTLATGMTLWMTRLSDRVALRVV